MEGQDLKLARLASDVVATSGGTIRMILNSPEALKRLEDIKTDSGFSIADHVRCAKEELDDYDAAMAEKLEQLENDPFGMNTPDAG